MNVSTAYGPTPSRNTEVELFSVAGVDGYLRQVNQRFALLLGFELDSLAGHSILELVHPDDVPDLVAGLAALQGGAQEVMLENRFRRQDGGWTHLQWVARPLTDTDLWWAAGRDTTRFHRLAAHSAELRARLDVAVNADTTAMWELDFTAGILSWEAPAASLMDTDFGELPESLSALADWVRPEDAAAVRAAADGLRTLGATDVDFAVTGPGAPGTIKHLSLRGKVLERDRRDRPVRAVGLLVDRTTEKAMEEQLLRMVLTDALTGAPNRRAFDQTLRSEWRRTGRAEEPLSVCIVDIDNFKSFNDTFGHLVGDEVLITVARSLTTGLGDDTGALCRFGGEEFAVVLPGLSVAHATAAAERMCEAVRRVRLRQAPGWQLGVSIGVATVNPADATVKATQLLARADQALYAAKADGKDRVVSFDRTLAGRAALEEAIAAGIRDGQFILHYQPIVELAGGRAVGLEALMRWERPGYALLAPDDFIPVAEGSDLICDLGRLALCLAAEECRGWTQELRANFGARPDVRVAVNLSGRHVSDPAVVDDVRKALTTSGLRPDQLEVELTETALTNGVLAQRHLEQLRDLGVSVSIDDFGTGYTSVGQLPSLPASVLKIDRSFVASSERRDHDLVRLMVGAAHAFGLRVVAEGVESDRLITDMQRLGCDEAQGYGIARPMAAARVVEWLRNNLQWPSLTPSHGVGDDVEGTVHAG